ncbi:MAG: PEP/pyruvate-binding domain-containing protein, partial [Propionibacteriaceae bacterium]
MNAVRQFEQLSADDGAQAGGKGANLGELVTAGLPVPPGFVIATAAYDAFVDETGIRDGVLQAA